MTPAENLARHIWRLAHMRGKLRAPTIEKLARLDNLLDRACQAIGSSDSALIAATTRELEAVQ